MNKEKKGLLDNIIFKMLFIYPGTAVLWFRYMFPAKGNLWISARHFRGPGNIIFKIFFSIIFWIGLMLFLIVIASEITKN